MICTTQYYHDILLKNEKHTQKHVYKASYSQCQQYTFNKLSQINSNQYSKLKFFKTQHQLKNPRNQGNKHEILRENTKTHTFSWRLKLRRWWKWWIFGWNTESMCERRTNKTMNSKKCSREKWKVLKTVLKAQNTCFSWLNQVTNKLPRQVAEHVRDKIF